MSVWAMCMVIFLTALHPDPRNVRRLYELSKVAWSIAKTDATEDEATLLSSIAIHESGVSLRAIGPLGERGAFQLLGGPYTTREALRRLRVQGLRGYAGCVRPCPKLVAALSRWASSGE
jgi:hypothetical protein